MMLITAYAVPRTATVTRAMLRMLIIVSMVSIVMSLI